MNTERLVAKLRSRNPYNKRYSLDCAWLGFDFCVDELEKMLKNNHSCENGFIFRDGNSLTNCPICNADKSVLEVRKGKCKSYLTSRRSQKILSGKGLAKKLYGGMKKVKK